MQFWQAERRAVRFSSHPPCLLASYKVILDFQKEPQWEDKSPTWMLMSFLTIFLPCLLYLDPKQISTVPLPWWGIGRVDQWIVRKGPCAYVKSQISLMPVLSKQVKYHLTIQFGDGNCGQFSFQSLRKAIPKSAQTTAQLHSSHMLVK